MIAPKGLGTLLRGLGDTLSYYDLLAQANLQSCSPMDSECVSNNVAKQAAVEDLWANRFQTTGAPAGTQLMFTPQTPAQVLQFYNPANYANGGNVVNTQGIMNVSIPTTPLAKATGNAPTGAAFRVSLDKANYNVGDSFLLTISGAAPNTAVMGSGIKDGVINFGTTNFGNTDGNGNWTHTGVMDASTAGQWNETWVVGGNSAALNFMVMGNGGSQASPANTARSTSQMSTPGTLSVVPSGNLVGDYITGLMSIISPADWSSIFSQGSLPEILGLMTVPGIMVFYAMTGRRH